MTRNSTYCALNALFGLIYPVPEDSGALYFDPTRRWADRLSSPILPDRRKAAPDSQIS